jgi:hypothetical protein
MPRLISDRPLARELISIGDEAIATEDEAKLRAYFREDYVFHGPGADLTACRIVGQEEGRGGTVPPSIHPMAWSMSGTVHAPKPGSFR